MTPRIYVPQQQEVKVGEPIIGWDKQDERYTITSAVTNIQNDNGQQIATTEYGQYEVVRK